MSQRKIGRNELCPCGSRRKFKHCHGSVLNRSIGSTIVVPHLQTNLVHNVEFRSVHDGRVPPEVLAKAASIFQEQQRKEQERIVKYGHGRPDITAEWNGKRVVGIGNKMVLMPADKCRFLTDVLMNYVMHSFGKEWFDAEIAKPAEKRHPVMQWRIKGMNYMNAQPQLPDGSYTAIPTGPLLAYLSFAYDLYVAENNSQLIDLRFIQRLKHVDQFQGARHEVFAAATCIRAGFGIEVENQSDRKSRHAEFNVTHVATNLKLSVEAKSKHRPGVLGRAGHQQNSNSMSLPFGDLLRDAVAKNPPHPLVVFLDMNMPFDAANRFLYPQPGGLPHPFITKTLNRLRREHDGKDPITMLVMTNHPSHYTKDHEISATAHLMTQVSQVPSRSAPLQILWALHRAANLYGMIPQEFSKN
jgi:hypothetical protein